MSRQPNLEEETSTSYRRRRHAQEMRRDGRCTLCPAHRGENVTHSKRGQQKRRKRNRR